MCFLRSPLWLACFPHPPHCQRVGPLRTESSSTCLSISTSASWFSINWVRFYSDKVRLSNSPKGHIALKIYFRYGTVDSDGEHVLADLCTSRARLLLRILPQVVQVYEKQPRKCRLSTWFLTLVLPRWVKTWQMEQRYLLLSESLKRNWSRSAGSRIPEKSAPVQPQCSCGHIL